MMRLGEIMLNKQVNKRRNEKTSQVRKYFVLFLLGVCFLNPAYAEKLAFTQFGWKIKTSKPVMSSITTGAIKKDSLLNIIAWAPKEMYEIGEWMAEMKYPQAGMWRSLGIKKWIKQGKPKGTVNLVHGNTDSGVYDTTKGEIDIYIDELLNDIKKVPEKIKVIEGKHIFPHKNLLNHSSTLAHEIFHGVHRTIESSRYDDKYKWITEGIPEAVGDAWTAKKYTAVISRTGKFRPKYDESLFSPIEPYSRGHFFLKLGDYLEFSQNRKYGSMKRGTMRYVKELLETKITKDTNDKMAGALWLNTFLNNFYIPPSASSSKNKSFVLAHAYSNIVSYHSNASNYKKNTCETIYINLDMDGKGSETKKIKEIFKISSKCFKVHLKGEAGIKGTVEINTTAKSEVINSIFSIGAQLPTSGVYIATTKPLFFTKSGFDRVAKYSSATWRFRNVPTNDPITFILANISRDVAQTVKISDLTLEFEAAVSTGKWTKSK